MTYLAVARITVGDEPKRQVRDLKFAPDWRVHPGEILRETIEERGMSQSYLAWATGYTQKHINQVVQGHVGISVEMALRLEEQLDISAEVWLRAQMIFDLHRAREAR